MFTAEWVLALREQLAALVAPGGRQILAGNGTVLQKVFERYRRREVGATAEEDCKAQYEALQQQFALMKKNQEGATVKLLESQTKWTGFAKDILTISEELFKAIRTLQGHGTVPQEFLDMSAARMHKYEVFLNENEAAFKRKAAEEESVAEVPEELETTPTASFHDPQNKVVNSNTAAGNVAATSAIQTSVSFAALDHAKVKQFLLVSTHELKVCAILQALKWRLLKAQKGEPRRQVLQWLVTYDLLGSCAPHKEDVASRLLRSTSRKYSGGNDCVELWNTLSH